MKSTDVSLSHDVSLSFEERMRLSAQRLSTPRSSANGSPTLNGDQTAKVPPPCPPNASESKANSETRQDRRRLIIDRNPASVSSSLSAAASCERILPDDGGPPARRANIDANVIADACESVVIFQGLHYKDRVALYSNLFELNFKAGETIIQQGTAGRNMYIVVQGYPIVCEQNSVDEVHDDDYDDVQIHQQLGPGDTFGEAALVCGCSHSFSVCVPTNSREIKVWALSRHTFRTLVSNATFARRKQLADVLVAVPPFMWLCDYTRITFTQMFATKHFEAGEMILGEGVPSRCHVIIKGQATAYTSEWTSELLGPNEYFGEEDLILNRTGSSATTVVAYCPTETWSIDLCSFRRILEHTPLQISELKHLSKFREVGPTSPKEEAGKAASLRKINSVPDIKKAASTPPKAGNKALIPTPHGSCSLSSTVSPAPKGRPPLPGQISNSTSKGRPKRIVGASGLKNSRRFGSMNDLQDALLVKPAPMLDLTLQHFSFLKEIGMGLTCHAYLCLMPKSGKHVVIKKMNKANLIKHNQVGPSMSAPA
ncbi:hypothetical protein CYMTET_15529 [Cymbomonas tetramitiformis]|uniref:Cyclic nucleotide-binding domain-containing protein n=1 Tax=Cymbomonas tetramitiformis TaxID=36881 RepID=A0AAE0GE53_9CHLO|nr:hypothetical protein CYMTET_15529 [Cymbomonas tetramitiformis]